MNVLLISTIAMETRYVIIQWGHTTVLARVDTKEMASTAQVLAFCILQYF